jgi:hypothetical protein
MRPALPLNIRAQRLAALSDHAECEIGIDCADGCQDLPGLVIYHITYVAIHTITRFDVET